MLRGDVASYVSTASFDNNKMRSGPATRTAFAIVNLTSAWPRSVPSRNDVANVPVPALSCEDAYAPENVFASDPVD